MRWEIDEISLNDVELQCFCTAWPLHSVTVPTVHSNTQQCLQPADSGPVESVFYWRCPWRGWTCFSKNPCSTRSHQCQYTQPTLVVPPKPVLSIQCYSYWYHMRPYIGWSSFDWAGYSQKLADWAPPCGHLEQQKATLMSYGIQYRTSQSI